MVQQVAASQAADAADAVSNAVTSPDGSLFVREVLEKALSNPAGVAPRWAADAWALLANVLTNDYFNEWNYAGQDQLRQAEDAMYNALALAPRLSLAHHAQGLIYRARGDQQQARKAFKRARDHAKELGTDFARAHAQIGNQRILCGHAAQAHEYVDAAIKLNPNNPAIGYFYWVRGRAFVNQGCWSDAVEALQKSVCALKTVWYNRAYLCYAKQKNGNSAGAESTFAELNNNPLFKTKLAQLKSSGKEAPNDAGAAMRNALRDWLAAPPQ